MHGFAEHGWFRFLENFGSTFSRRGNKLLDFFWRGKAEHQWSLWNGNGNVRRVITFHCFSSPYYEQIAHGMSQKAEGGRGGGCIYFKAVRTEASRVLKQNAWISQKKNPFKKYNTCSVPLCCKCAYFICEMPFLKHG